MHVGFHAHGFLFTIICEFTITSWNVTPTQVIYIDFYRDCTIIPAQSFRMESNITYHIEFYMIFINFFISVYSVVSLFLVVNWYFVVSLYRLACGSYGFPS